MPFFKKFETVPGLIYGSKRKYVAFDHESSFLPYTLDRQAYLQPVPLMNLPRPYRADFVPLPLDDGSQYAALEQSA